MHTMPASSSPSLPYVLVEDAEAGVTWCYERPREVVVATTLAEISPALERLQALREDGCFLAGNMAYEAGYAFEPRLMPLFRRPQGPLLAFGAFEGRRAYAWPAQAQPFPAVTLRPQWDLAGYRARFGRVIEYIRAGDIYQANLTFPLTGTIAGDPLALYAALRERQPPRHGAFVALSPDQTLLSLSPELFFAIEDGVIRARPMKGTAPRGGTPQEDTAFADGLRASEKDRAENLMIVDLLRNDLGRLAEIGSVEVTDLFTIEPYATLFQMTSGITARLKPGTTLRALFGALFPCGSVTGAPKIRAMQIIHALEEGPRGAYCGAIGHITPEGDARFNVAIRTAILDNAGNITLNVGSGVVYDSLAEAEYEECWLKARFLTG